MAFWKKGDDDSDLEDIKDKVSRGGPESNSPPSAEREEGESPPEPVSGPLPDPPPAPAEQEEVDEALQHSLRASDMAPLFVKIDRYHDILEQLEDIKVSMRNMTDVMMVLNEIERTRESAVKELRDSVNDLADDLIALDGEFVRPEEAEIEVPKSQERAEVEQYVGDLRSELKSLKKELAKMK